MGALDRSHRPRARSCLRIDGLAPPVDPPAPTDAAARAGRSRPRRRAGVSHRRGDQAQARARRFPTEAARAARRAFGNVTLAKEKTRGVWVSGATERLLQDLRFGFRILINAPLLLLSAVTLVALVIGGNTTVYSIARAILNKPAPGVRAENLVTVSWVRKDGFVSPKRATRTIRIWPRRADRSAPCSPTSTV